MIRKIYGHFVFATLESWISKIMARRQGYESFRILGNNMSPTLKSGQLIRFLPLQDKKMVARGEVVVMRSSKFGKDLVPSRVVGIAGDKVELIDAGLYINSESVFEFYLNKDTAQTEYSLNYGPTVIPTGFVFVLGDCRDISKDSRYFGPFEMNEIAGKLILPAEV